MKVKSDPSFKTPDGRSFAYVMEDDQTPIAQVYGADFEEAHDKTEGFVAALTGDTEQVEYLTTERDEIETALSALLDALDLDVPNLGDLEKQKPGLRMALDVARDLAG